jgi:hypothetical protein
MDSRFINVVQSAMRAAAVCPACGKSFEREEGIRLRGERYHRLCAYYPAPRKEAPDES